MGAEYSIKHLNKRVTIVSRELEIILRGAQADFAADELASAFSAAHGAPCSLVRRPATARDMADQKGVDPLAVTALVLSVPSALLAVLDIADRIKKRRTAQSLIEQSERLRIEHGVESWVVTAEGPRALDRLTVDQLLELATELNSGNSDPLSAPHETARNLAGESGSGDQTEGTN